MLNRNELLFSLFDPSGFGLEIGPSYNPLLPKRRGYNVEIVDHADAASLREKYRDDASKIEEVDYVSDGRTLLETIGYEQRYDFIFASHVIEHVTDIVRFLQDCETLLKPGGRLVLAVPDKRFCFDALRPLSTVGQTLQAHAEKRKRHTPGILFDQVSYVCTKAKQTVWLEPTFDDVAFLQSDEEAKSMFEAVQVDTAYYDAHAWQFTPASFRFLIKKLRSLGYIKSGELAFHKNEPGQLHLHEFYISLSKNAPVLHDSDVDLLKEAERELREVAVSRDELSLQIAAAHQQIQSLIATNQALLKSTSWKITAPLRYVRSVFL